MSVITVFTWNEFPVEVDSFFTCVCVSEKEENDTDKILDYITMVYPEKVYHYKTSEDFLEYKKNESSKSSVILDLRREKTNWRDNLNIIQQYLNVKTVAQHIIIVGVYENIPKLALTVADIMIFDEEETINKYLSERHNMKLNGFDYSKHFPMIDKRKLGFNIHGLDKALLS